MTTTHDWISVKKALPKNGVIVEVRGANSIEEARINFSHNAWIFPSGIRWRDLSFGDYWRPLQK